MNTYPEVPSEPVEGGWPAGMFRVLNSLGHSASHCPICDSYYVAYLDQVGQSGFADESKLRDKRKFKKNPPMTPTRPSVVYECGGVYRDLGNGFWGGRCYAKKHQQELTFAEEE